MFPQREYCPLSELSVRIPHHRAPYSNSDHWLACSIRDRTRNYAASNEVQSHCVTNTIINARRFRIPERHYIGGGDRRHGVQSSIQPIYLKVAVAVRYRRSAESGGVNRTHKHTGVWQRLPVFTDHMSID